VFRTSDIVLIAVMVAAAAFTYKTKHDAENRLDEIVKLEAAIRTEEDTITILKADWSLLTQPTRLQKLTEIYASELNLQPVQASQIVGLDDLPAKPIEIEDLSNQPLGGMAEGPVKDQTVTGGIVQ
jgi:hypothetical protein